MRFRQIHIRLVGCLLGCLTFVESVAQSSPYPMLPAEQLAFQTGEVLHYVLHYKWLGIRMDVGEATACLLEDILATEPGGIHAVVTGNTYKFWDVFFKVREHFESRFRVPDFRPNYFMRDVYEGGYTMKNHYVWNPDHTIQARVERCQDPVKDTLLPATATTYDLVTLFYLARNIDFDQIPIGENQPISFAIDDEIFEVYFRFVGRERKKIYALGWFHTMKFAAKVIAGEVFNGDHELIIYVSDDENRIPLLFESKIRVGTVSGRLVGYEQLRYPLTAKIEEK